MKNNTMIPYNPKKDLETNYYNKTEVELLIAGGGTGGTIDLSNYYKKLETYSKEQVDALISSGIGDLSDYYTKAEVDSLITNSGADLSNYYNKTEVDTLIDAIPTTDLSGYYKKTETYSKVEVDTIIDNIPETDLTNYYKKTEVDSLIDAIPEADLTNYYNKTQVDAIALDKVDKVVGKQLSTEDYTTAEKTKLSGLSNYIKPASEPISYIDNLQTSLDSKVEKLSKQSLDSTDALRVSGTTVSLYKGDGTFDSINTQDTIYTHPTSGVTAGTYSKVTVNELGHITDGTNLTATDIPSLDASKITTGIIDASRLPSFIDDVLEFANLAGFPLSGETGKIYIALDTNKAYRWSGSTYVYITSGAVDSVNGKTGAVSLTKSDIGLSNVDNTSDSSKNVLSATKLATARTIALSGGVVGSVSFDGSTDVTIDTTIQPDSVTLGTDTTGNYMVDITPGSGISVTHTQGEGSTAVITNSEPNVTTDISTTHNSTSVVVHSSDGTDGIIDSATQTLAGVMSADDKTKLDGIDSRLANLNVSRADKVLASKDVAKLIYDNGNLVKIRYTIDDDVDYEVLTYSGEDLTNVAHYLGGVLQGNTVLTYASGELVSSIFVGV